MGCYNQYKTRRLLIHRMQKSAKLHTLALWGLATNYWEGGLQHGNRGASEVLPLQKSGGAEKSFSHAEVGGHKSFEVVLTWQLEVLAIVMRWGRKKFQLFRVRLRWLGVVLPGYCKNNPNHRNLTLKSGNFLRSHRITMAKTSKRENCVLYSFLFSNDILIMIINYKIAKRGCYIKSYNIWLSVIK